MAKIGDLKLSPDGSPRDFEKKVVEPDDRALEAMTVIEEMMDDGKYKFAEDTLQGILTKIQGCGRITLGQRRAVENIYNSKLKSWESELDWKHR